MARPKQGVAAAADGPAVTDPDLVRLVPKYGAEGRRILEVLQAGRDRNRASYGPPSTPIVLDDPEED